MQPYVHHLVPVLGAPIQAWSLADGQAPAGGAIGVYCGDDLAVAGFILEVPSHDVDPVAHESAGGRAVFRWLLRTPKEGIDPVVSLTRARTVVDGALEERLVLESAAAHPVRVRMRLRLDCSIAGLHDVKGGQTLRSPAERPDAASPSWHWRDADTVARLSTDGALCDGPFGAWWDVEVAPGERVERGWRLELRDDAFPFAAPARRRTPALETAALPRRCRRLLDVCGADLAALQLVEREHPERQFCAAGAPWFFTLFGRDSLITALFLARACPELGWSTLHTLAARQGTRTDLTTAEEPGKILHEVRRADNDLHDGSTVLPSVYFGTVDATLLWIMLLDELAGLTPEPAAPVAALLDPLLGTVTWLLDHADADGDGLIEYLDRSGSGLANQGWKDSGDSIRFADGTIAEGPIRLVEVQGYAFAAARAAARLLRAHGRTDDERALAARLDARADDVARSVREHYWLEDARGPYLALALDGEHRPVSGVASNMGHLLGTGILTADEERLVVDRLMDRTMWTGFGIRTMSSDNGAYWPLRYHVGSVWTHDTAWIVAGLRRAGFDDEAARVASGLLDAAETMGFRPPELFGGAPSEQVDPPMPYPASCRPQAWAAASAFVIAEALSPR